MSFEHIVPTKVIFGKGELSKIGDVAKEYGDKALVVTGRNSAKKHGYLDGALDSLEAVGLQYIVFDDISPNPRSYEVTNAIKFLRDYSCDFVIGFGGGSAIDASKAISLSPTYNSVKNIIGKTLSSGIKALPVLAVPTTAGSGAEVTKGAIITDVERGFKAGIRGDVLFPKVAIVDPELTYSLPPDVTAQTGFDALTHAIESYVAKKANPITDMFAEKSMKLIANNLERAIMDNNEEARSNMSFASMLAGMNIANASSCLPHRLQQAMGSVLDISHGNGLAVVYPAWLKQVYPYAKEKLDVVGEIFGGEGYTPIINFMKKIGMRRRIRDFNPDKGIINKFLSNITGDITNDPMDTIATDLIKIIYEVSF